MKLIVGLGNPGNRYRGTRHNIGAAVVRELAGESGIDLKKGLFASSETGRARMDSREVLLAVPLTYMNCSGPAVSALVRRHRVAPEDLLVVHDDLDLDFARIKARIGGASGGHNGLKSVIASVGSPDFCRLRIGIGRPPRGVDPAEFVLDMFTREEQEKVRELTAGACSAARAWAVEGISKTMNEFNR